MFQPTCLGKVDLFKDKNFQSPITEHLISQNM